MKFKPRTPNNRGFALIVTLSLMILLTVVAVGLLSLSSISIRTSSQGDAMSKARANARLALMLALGELQKTAGPDKAITATSGILAAKPAKGNLAGVWESWDFDPASSSLAYSTEKESRFRSWLVSDADPKASAAKDYATKGWTGDTIELVGEKTLGKPLTAEAKTIAGRVPVTRNGRREGSYAWHVADESVKARINSYRDPDQNGTLAMKRALLAGHRPDVSVMKSEDKSDLASLPNDQTTQGYSVAMESSGKMVSLGQADLLAGKKIMGKFHNDVTPYSLGLLTNVRKGGLKQDLTSIFEGGVSTLPLAYKGNRLYKSLITSSTYPSDPYWSALSGYYNIYKSSSIKGTSSNPTYYEAPPAAVNMALAQPQNFYPAPVIAKVEVLFSLVVRDAHSPHASGLLSVSPEMKYMCHFLYTPLITLHNPYNVTIQFDKMQVAIRGVPMGFKFLVNNQSQITDYLPLDRIFLAGQAVNKGAKTFALDIANWSSPSAALPNGTIKMKPGQTLLCGPYLSPSASFNNDAGTPFFDWRNDGTMTGNVDAGGNVTASVKARPGFVGNQFGYDVDWLTPPGYTSVSNDGNSGVLGLKATDLVRVESKVMPPTMGTTDRFEVNAQITSKGKTVPYGGLSFIYGTKLPTLFPKPTSYPETGGISAISMYYPNGTPLSSQTARSVAMFSAYARTTNGGVYETNERVTKPGSLNVLQDGRYAGKPFLHHNAARPLMSINLNTEKPGTQSHELNFLGMRGTVDDVFSADSDNRTYGMVSYRKIPGKSIKSGSCFELPTGPMQTIADFRRSNALSSPYLPNFVQPIGNSYASPLMSTSSAVEAGTAGYQFVDHSVMANHALYDGFYFSTIAAQGSNSAEKQFENFMERNLPLPSQAFQPYMPADRTLAMAKAALFSGASPAATAYQESAEYQMVKGAFNVNSTNIQAWKAMLCTLNKTSLQILWAKSGAVEEIKSLNFPIPSMSLQNGALATGMPVGALGKIDDPATNEWNGYREFSESDIELLATKIVEQVRLRGPFLSMSEFVNRQIGPDSALTRTGALQAAIDESKLNEDNVFKNQVPILASDVGDVNIYGYKTPAAAEGNPAAGAPSWLTQGDLLRLLEPAATVRSDTFVIRTCGETTDAAGKVIARAYAEAVVQRLPEYVDPSNRPSVNVYDGTAGLPVNRLFGRRISMLSFRWLSASEI